ELDGLLEVEEAEAGMHVVGWLAPHISEASASREAARMHIEAIGLSAYAMRPLPRAGLVLGFAGLDEAVLVDGIAGLRQALLRADGHRPTSTT
ncbi:MAG TPA: hypothetical protein VGO93_17820, partial [Candidatus Xenobia bacterium]